VLELVELDTARVVSIDDLEEWSHELSLDGDFQLSNHVGKLVDGQVSALVQVEVRENFL
jgi:hypothetical protein